MTRFIKSPYNERYPANTRDVNEMLGLPRGANLPKEGMNPRTIQGFTVWVTALPDRPNGGRKRSTHRVLAECPDCKRTVSVGRLRQHVCKLEKLQPGELDPRD